MNGEGTAYGFRKSGLSDDLVIWNEALVEGPVSSPLFSDGFFKARRDFFRSEFVDQYDTVFLGEFRKLLEVKDRPLILWFEHDLFCQVNLIALLSWIWGNHRGPVSLISINKHPNHPFFQGLGQLSPTELADLYPDRLDIPGEVAQFADQIWKSYSGPDPIQLFKLIFEEDHPQELPFLKSSFTEHFRRFPSAESGLNQVQEQILSMAKQTNSLKTIMRSLFEENSNLGYGDLQYLNEIERLTGFVRLNDDKLELVNQPTFEQAIDISDNHFVGGARATQFLWDEKSGVLTTRI